jgi:hypothetical protein
MAVFLVPPAATFIHNSWLPLSDVEIARIRTGTPGPKHNSRHPFDESVAYETWTKDGTTWQIMWPYRAPPRARRI